MAFQALLLLLGSGAERDGGITGGGGLAGNGNGNGDGGGGGGGGVGFSSIYLAG
jgi:hypothetical protein